MVKHITQQNACKGNTSQNIMLVMTPHAITQHNAGNDTICTITQHKAVNGTT
jgi:hypothetical protein